MKNMENRVDWTSFTCGRNRRRRVVWLIQLFIILSLGFLLYDFLYEELSTSEIRSAIAHPPQKLGKIRDTENNENPPVFLKPLKQFFNLTGIKHETELAKLLQLWKEPNLLNLNFTWLKNNESICHLNGKVMPILIHTSRSHFKERQVIRGSWGSASNYKNWTIRLVFLIGEADHDYMIQTELENVENEEKKLDEEQSINGDLVMGSFIDSYKNLRFKHLMGYKWILNFCQNAEFVLKVDDDMFVDVMRLIDWREKELENTESDDELSQLYCYMLGGDPNKPMRDSESKWYVPDEYYPDYCSGWTYAITVDLMEHIYSVSNLIKFFWIDDVFVTGALMEVVRKVYNYEPDIRYLLGKISMEPVTYLKFCERGDSSRKRAFGVVALVERGVNFERDMMCMWNKILYDFDYELS